MRIAPLALAAVLALSGCTGSSGADTDGDGGTASTEAPKNGACRVIDAEIVARDTDDTDTVACGKPHTAETFEVGTFSKATAEKGYDSDALAAEVYPVCQKRFEKFVGADESLALRTVLTWAWWRPTEAAWDAGARWYRCDVVAGPVADAGLVELPKTVKGVLLGRPGDRWLACVDAEQVEGSPWVSCASRHTWRAVTTIVVGKDKEAYPGDRIVEVTTRDYCRRSVLYWLDFPVEYEFGYTFFHEAEWQQGIRRSICWARTDA